MEFGPLAENSAAPEEPPVTDAPRRLPAVSRPSWSRQLHVGRLIFILAYTAAWIFMVYGAQLLLRRLF
jgi:hypothetical protein